MTPLLATLAGDSARGYGMFGGVLSGDFNSISTVTLTTTAATVTFSSIPSIYTHLQIRAMAINTAGASGNYTILNFNGDTGNNYSWHYSMGDGTNGYTGGNNTTGSIRFDQVRGATNSNSYPQSTVMDILNYTNTNMNTTTRALDGGDGNGAGGVSLNSGAWYNTAAVTSIVLSAYSTGSASTFGINSSFALYGIKG
jgi:hypothetical protein